MQFSLMGWAPQGVSSFVEVMLRSGGLIRMFDAPWQEDAVRFVMLCKEIMCLLYCVITFIISLHDRTCNERPVRVVAPVYINVIYVCSIIA